MYRVAAGKCKVADHRSTSFYDTQPQSAKFDKIQDSDAEVIAEMVADVFVQSIDLLVPLSHNRRPRMGGGLEIV